MTDTINSLLTAELVKELKTVNGVSPSSTEISDEDINRSVLNIMTILDEADGLETPCIIKQIPALSLMAEASQIIYGDKAVPLETKDAINGFLSSLGRELLSREDNPIVGCVASQPLPEVPRPPRMRE